MCTLRILVKQTQAFFFFAHANNSVCFANPTRGRLLSECVTIRQCASPGLMKGGGRKVAVVAWALQKPLSLKGPHVVCASGGSTVKRKISLMMSSESSKILIFHTFQCCSLYYIIHQDQFSHSLSAQHGQAASHALQTWYFHRSRVIWPQGDKYTCGCPQDAL